MNDNSSDMRGKIKRILSAHADVTLVFLFGSRANDSATSFSDIDIAIFFSALPNFYDINDLKERLSRALMEEVDIVVLNNASPIIKMQVLKKGVLLVNKDSRICKYCHSGSRSP